MDSGHLSANLLKWLATFQAGANATQPEDISDGVIIATVLHEIEPLWFDDAWLAKIKTDAGDNWRLKVSNLKKVTQGINDYLSDSLELNISHLTQPDVNKLGETASVEEAGRLLQLVLGVAVNCSRKQEYIESIQELEPTVQAALMAAIQELMARGGPGGGPLSSSAGSLLDVDPLPALASELEMVKDERHQIQQRCYELDNQIALLQDEKSVLQEENQKLQKRLQLQQELPDAEGEGESPEQRQRYKQIIQKLAANNEEIYKLEATREELRVRCEMMEKDLRETQAKNEELQRLADETRRLRDELEILRDLTAKVPQYEAKLDTYQKRLLEMGDLRRQIKLLEDKNTDYMQQNMELEEELKRSGSYRPQLDLYKKQVSELHEQLSEETKKRDKADFELRKLGEKMAALQSEKERLTEERDKLREANDELKLAQLQTGVVGSPLGSRPVDGAGGTSEPQLDPTPTDVKEKLLRLQHENRQLRSQVAGGDQEGAYRAMLDDLRGRETALQAENRSLNQRILELQSQLEERTPEQTAAPASGSRLYSLEQELQNKTMQIGEMEIRLAEQANRTQELQEQLSRRDGEMADMEERYKKYLEKAKAVIRSLDTKAGSPDVSVLKHQLAEKERQLEVMEKENEKTKSIREAEERLIATAFYNYGSQMHRQAVEQRLSNISGGQSSFLARQRQANTRRLHGNRTLFRIEDDAL
ncbi:protein Hook homolog 3-like isoform X1 [Amphibalanus amphitrite]|uniref:protein Hook homolog 3-like isoform X1 n=1 Tax=Amphibalanus amphitrite TaxID=1232801 RepID=UPI001C90F0E1|nr:protein Hook homolog 3-like isoform X1 [Amphibalanus amphitrite]